MLNLKNLLFFTLIMLCSIDICTGQTVLTAGDIAITGYRSDNPDQIDFVILKDVEMGTEIVMSDNGWFSDGFRSSEGIAQIQFGSDYSCGSTFSLIGTQVVQFLDSTSTSAGILGTVNINISASGDQIFIYQGPAPTNGRASNWITGINLEGNTWLPDTATIAGSGSSNVSTLPSALTDGVNAMSIEEMDNAIYDCSVVQGTPMDIRLAIVDNNNWNASNNDEFPLSHCNDFICESEPAVIPTMGQWGLIVLAFLLMIFGVTYSKSAQTIKV